MEKLIRMMIKKRAVTLFLIIIVGIAGAMGYYYLPQQENPDVSFPVAMIITPYPGASAEDVKELVLTKIEDEMLDLENIDEVTGTAKNGLGITIVMFNEKAENDKAMQDVRTAMEDAELNLPSGVMDSTIDTDLVSTAGILISLSGENYSYEQLASFGEQYKNRLKKIDGISKFEIEGELDKEIKIVVDTGKINALGISLSDVNNILQAQNIEIPSGAIQNGENRIDVSAQGTYEDIDDIKNTVMSISPETGISLRLRHC